MVRLLVSAGGTAGGVFPALAVVAELEGQAEVLWVGGAGGMEGRLVEGVNYEEIPAAGVHGVGARALPGNLLDLARGYRAASSIIRDYRPDVMLFTGGYVGVPTALAGSQIPQVAFVPDLSPGLALRLITRLADTVAVSNEAARRHYGNRRVVVTGYPTRPELQPIPREEARVQMDLDPERMVVVAFGGSRGARSINQAVWHSLPGLLDVAQVIHITGDLDHAQVEGVIEELPERLRDNYYPHAFLREHFDAALSAADLAISRAGASTMGEFPLFGLPAILVPYPHAWRYQKENAEYLERQGAALRIADEELARNLLPMVRRLLHDPHELERMRNAMGELAQPGAASALAGEVLRAAA